LAGILRGCGKQAVGAIANVIGYYAVGLPIVAIAVLRYGYQVEGLWFGLLSAVIVQVLISGVIVSFGDRSACGKEKPGRSRDD
jgi:MATE family multidrug resistance protein